MGPILQGLCDPLIDIPSSPLTTEPPQLVPSRVITTPTHSPREARPKILKKDSRAPTILHRGEKTRPFPRECENFEGEKTFQETTDLRPVTCESKEPLRLALVMEMRAPAGQAGHVVGTFFQACGSTSAKPLESILPLSIVKPLLLGCVRKDFCALKKHSCCHPPRRPETSLVIPRSTDLVLAVIDNVWHQQLRYNLEESGSENIGCATVGVVCLVRPSFFEKTPPESRPHLRTPKEACQLYKLSTIVMGME